MSLSTKRGKQAVLEWFQETTKSYKGVDVKDFSSSFADGLAFCATIHKFKNDLFDYDSLDASNSAANIKLAIDSAEKVGVSGSLEANNLEETEIFSFACQLFRTFNPDHPLLSRSRGRKRGEEEEKKEEVKEEVKVEVKEEIKEDTSTKRAGRKRRGEEEKKKKLKLKLKKKLRKKLKKILQQKEVEEKEEEKKKKKKKLRKKKKL